jgi:hypothetical protein
MKPETLRLIAVGMAVCLMAGPAHADGVDSLFYGNIPDGKALRQHVYCGFIAEGETPTPEEQRKIEECRREAAQERQEEREKEWAKERRERIQRSLARDQIYGAPQSGADDEADPADVERLQDQIDALKRKLRRLENSQP